MTRRTASISAALVLTAMGAAGLGVRGWAVTHVRRLTGRPNLPFVSCDHCHGVSLERIAWAKPRPHHASPAGLAVSPDSKSLFVAFYDLDQVAEVDLSSKTVVRRVPVAGRPTGLVLAPQRHRLYVTCRDGDRVAALDTPLTRVLETIEVGRGPVGIALCPTGAGDRLVVANSMSDNLSILATGPLRELTRLTAGREPFAVATSTDGARAWVVNRLATTRRAESVPASEVTVIDPLGLRVIDRLRLESAHLSEGICTVASRGWTLTPLVTVHNQVPITQVANGWVMSSGLAVADARGDVVQMPIDEANDYFADPAGVTVDAAGRRAYIASGGGDVVTVVDLTRLADWLGRSDGLARAEAIEDLTLSPEYVIARVRTGRNPGQLVLAPDGDTLFVAERLDDSVLMLDTKSLRPAGRIALGDGGGSDPIRRGERVFTQARFTFQHQFSCRSCHPDGHVDGLAYDFDTSGLGDNFLDNRSLQGVAGTAPFKWNGKNPSLEVQCGPRFARVLMRTEPIPPAELKDLTAFINSLPPARGTRRSNQPLTAAQARGRAVFFATTTSDGKSIPRARQCATCHRPPLYTNRLSSDVGTKGPRDPSGLFDTPHLLGIAASAPYLHDGRARTLEEIWTLYQTNDLHGVTSYMNKRQLNDLVEFLKTL